MKNLLILVPCISFAHILLFANAQNIRNLQAAQSLPQYVGSGYDIVSGDPIYEVAGADPGFRSPIFDFTYVNQKTTSDSNYLIPDQVQQTISSILTPNGPICSTISQVSQIRGTKSYQQHLKTFVQVNQQSPTISYIYFSKSPYWGNISEVTQSNKSITRATATCSVYKLSINEIIHPPIKSAFIDALILAHTNSNWDPFITTYGTHYVSSVMLGNSLTQQIIYGSQNVSLLNSLDVDINITAKATLAKFFNDSLFDWKSYSRSIDYSEKLKLNSSHITVGAQAPFQDYLTWFTSSRNNPVPVKIKLVSLSDLFDSIALSNPSLNFDSISARFAFESAVSLLCFDGSCGNVTEDFPQPPPAYTYKIKTHLYGANTGNDFQQFTNSTTMQLKSIVIKSAKQVDNLQLRFSDGVDSQYTTSAGGSGGVYSTWEVPDGEYVNQIEIKSGARIDSLLFITNAGTRSPRFGGDGGTPNVIQIPPGCRIAGFFGTYNNRLFRLGLILGLTIIPQRSFQSFSNIMNIQLTSITVTSTTLLNSLQLHMSDGYMTSFNTPVAGVHSGTESVWDIPSGQYINQIEYRLGTFIDSITFITNMGTKSSKYGGDGGAYRIITIPDDFRIIGMFGTYGYCIDQLGFVLAKVYYENAYTSIQTSETMRIYLN